MIKALSTGMQNVVDDNKDLRDRVEQLEEALANLIAACDAGRWVEMGAGGMTIESQLMRTVIHGVEAMAVEKARSVLFGREEEDEQED